MTPGPARNPGPARIRATPATRWDAASPCEGWTARDVVAHVINGHRGILAVVNGRPPAAADGVRISSMPDARLRATGAFRPSVPAPPDAAPQTAFLSFVGREP
ncbi:maleylpyruvate isomerase N-terminal domain-containing protein [Streptomyces scopuliridis]|uniref:maleylpyruvate isomerase N-terminal domain-containing protein n=1 Tax=Streptomyces scopuliridis TaxID=452529 RepID=UPI0035DA3E5B